MEAITRDLLRLRNCTYPIPISRAVEMGDQPGAQLCTTARTKPSCGLITYGTHLLGAACNSQLYNTIRIVSRQTQVAYSDVFGRDGE
ncbi:MAG: hypothetical protein MI923_24635 [Phycisphaerales bacterium]|nr:hypothetical protein [Phycisphaerales bacterium]